MFDRRRFLWGAGGVLALPWLESLHISPAQAQSEPPKRLALVYWHQGLVRTKWKPAQFGTLPSSGDISELLAPLNAHRNDVSVISGLMNVARHIVAGDNHRRTTTTILTGARPVEDQIAGGPSIDQVAKDILGGPSSSVRLPVTPTGRNLSPFFAATGRRTPLIGRNPQDAAMALFADLPTDDDAPEPASPTLRQRLVASRGSVLDSVAGNLGELRRRLPAADRNRLDEHTAAVERLLASSGSASPMMTPPLSCAAPDYAALPDFGGEVGSSRDNETAPAQVDNIARAFACDRTRVATLYFNDGQDPSFSFLFEGRTAASWAPGSFSNWHDMIHSGQPTGGDADDGVPALVRGQLSYIEGMAQLIDRLKATPDIDGESTLFDNTLVVGMSNFGDENHGSFDIPAIVAGMPDRVRLGQHIDAEGHTTNDFLSTILVKLGAPEGTRIGETGVVNYDNLSSLWASRGHRVARYDNDYVDI